LYYLNSRYYDPETGRFINADTTDVLENAKYNICGLNLYSYCDNNPVAGRDDEGDMSFWKKLAVAVAVVATVAVVAAVVCATAGTATPLCAIATTFVGAAKGAVVGAAVGAASGAVTGAVQGAVEGYQETGTLEGTLQGMSRGAFNGAVEGAKEGFISGLVSGGISGAASSIAGNPMFCFVAGTAVLTTLGKKAIEDIKVGEIVPCVDHITGEVAEKRVISTTVNKVDKLIELDIDGEIIQCTETHPFQVKGKGWVNACELVPGDVVYTKDWNTATVKSVNLLELDEPVEVFNFEVEDCHTYFVGDVCALVHNSACHQSSEWRAERKKYWKGEAEKYKGNVNDQLSFSENYNVTKDNMKRMLKGKAPIGIDNKPVNLHHNRGIKVDLYDYKEMTWTHHFKNFKELHTWV
jgi:RHS repeat-associated protein